jgi:hypothetical protein
VPGTCTFGCVRWFSGDSVREAIGGMLLVFLLIVWTGAMILAEKHNEDLLAAAILLVPLAVAAWLTVRE